MMQHLLAQRSDEATDVVRILIVSLGGFCAGVSLVLALRHLSPWVLPLNPKGGRTKARHDRVVVSLFLGLLLLAFSGVCVLTTDHIYRHLVANDTPAWQLWGALGSFAGGSVALVGLFKTRATNAPPIVEPDAVLQDPIGGPAER